MGNDSDSNDSLGERSEDSYQGAKNKDTSPWLSNRPLPRRAIVTSSSTSSFASINSNGRSQSIAYPKANTSTMLSKVQFYARRNTKLSLSVAAIVVTVVLVTSSVVQNNESSSSMHAARSGVHGLRGASAGSQSLQGVSPTWGGAINEGYFVAKDAVLEKNKFRFAAVTDLDKLSRVKDKKIPTFRAELISGILTKDERTGRYNLELDEDRKRDLLTKHNEGGRGAEFSELTIYGNRLLTFDDRTGGVFEILNKPDGKDSYVVPRFFITEGNGETDKGMKWEWATVKDGELFLGSMGKEFIRKDGTVKNRNNLWIAVLNGRGEMRRVDWTEQYNVVRKALNAVSPGYMINEAVNWSDKLKKWVFLPRRVSFEMYDESKDEKKGGHQLVLVDEHFTKVEVVDIKTKKHDPLKGFSTFAFVPGSNDEHALAVRSVEENCVGFSDTCSQRSYFFVFNVKTGDVLSNEVKSTEDVKFEGVEFVDIYKVPPKN